MKQDKRMMRYVCVVIFLLPCVSGNAVSELSVDNLDTKVSEISERLTNVENVFESTQEVLSDFAGKIKGRNSSSQSQLVDQEFGYLNAVTRRKSSSASLYGVVINFVATPTSVLTSLTPTLTLRCCLNKTSQSASPVSRRDVTSRDYVAEVISVVMTLQDQDMAAVTRSRPAHVTDRSANVRVVGSVVEDRGAYLELTIQQPDQNQTGKFVCEVNAVTQSGHIVTFTKSVEVIAKPPTVSDLVTYVAQLNKQVIDLTQQNNDAIVRNEDLKLKYDDLREDHDHLKFKVDTKVFFSAKRSSTLLTTSQPVVVVFDKVLSNMGGAYNSATGEFLCQVAGYYQFQFTLFKNSKRRTYAHLNQNDKRIASVYNPATSTEDTSAVSVIVRLVAGDRVYVVLEASSYIYNDVNDQYATFSGLLISTD